VKRHESLQPLSKEHHEVLIIAQLLKKDAPPYKGLPRDQAGRASYAIQFYTDHIITHFYTEERVLFPAITGYDDRIDDLVAELRAEHSQIISLFEQLKLGIDPAFTMDMLGKLLTMHVRKEERELFELVQSHVPPAVLEKLSLNEVE
jgi:iron-sulfur cluster repair protein YtfE (RIC family)